LRSGRVAKARNIFLLSSRPRIAYNEEAPHFARKISGSSGLRKIPDRQQLASQPLVLPTGKPPVSGQMITGNTSPVTW
jgi:hypothetical protein